jgi:hypothetical protein
MDRSGPPQLSLKRSPRQIYLRTRLKERRVCPNDGAPARALRGIKRARPATASPSYLLRSWRAKISRPICNRETTCASHVRTAMASKPKSPSFWKSSDGTVRIGRSPCEMFRRAVWRLRLLRRLAIPLKSNLGEARRGRGGPLCRSMAAPARSAADRIGKPRAGKFDAGKVRVRGIQNVVPFSKDYARDGQDCRSLPGNPGVSQTPGRNLLVRA